MQRLLLLIAAFLPLAGQAQSVPNNGLENWAQNGLHRSPVDWYTTDDAVAARIGSLLTFDFVTRSTDRYAGSYAAQLASKALPIPLPGVTGFAPSILLLGRGLNQANPATSGGFPFTSRPGSVRFWYKLTLAANDNVRIAAGLTNGPRATQQTTGAIGGGVLDLNGSTANRNTFTQGIFNIDYLPNNTLTPDTLRLGFVVGNGLVSASSTFIVDEITFGARVTTSTKPSKALAALSVYPNPSSTGEFALASLDNPAVATAPLTVTDALGRVVHREPAVARSLHNGRRLDLQALTPGIYLLNLQTDEGPVAQRLVIR